MLKRAVIARNLHRWFGLVVGLQLLIWLVTGLYMVVVDIDFIHGDPMVKNMQQTVAVPLNPQLNLTTVRNNYPDSTHIGLKAVMGKTFYTVSTAGERYLLDPESGEVISPLNESLARDIAKFHFNGDAPILNAALVTSDAPMEIQTRRLPLWRIDFNDRFSTSFYIDPYTGGLATRRHQYWRIFDFLWMLHIMDYEERTDAHNGLLIVAQVTGLVFAVTGLWLLVYSFSPRRTDKAATK